MPKTKTTISSQFSTTEDIFEDIELLQHAFEEIDLLQNGDSDLENPDVVEKSETNNPTNHPSTTTVLGLGFLLIVLISLQSIHSYNESKISINHGRKLGGGCRSEWATCKAGEEKFNCRLDVFGGGCVKIQSCDCRPAPPTPSPVPPPPTPSPTPPSPPPGTSFVMQQNGARMQNCADDYGYGLCFAADVPANTYRDRFEIVPSSLPCPDQYNGECIRILSTRRPGEAVSCGTTLVGEFGQGQVRPCSSGSASAVNELEQFVIEEPWAGCKKLLHVASGYYVQSSLNRVIVADYGSCLDLVTHN